MLPHCLAKVRSSSFGIPGRKCKRKCNMHWFLNTHRILMHLAYLLTCCVNFRCLLNILCQIANDFYLNKCCELKQRFLHVWDGTDQTIIDNAIDEWRGCLCAYVRAKGGHFEQLSWQYSNRWHETFQFLSYVTQFLDCFFGIYHKFELSQGSAVTQWRYSGKYYMSFVAILLLFQQWKNFENPLRIEKVIIVSLVYYFFGTQCTYYTQLIRHQRQQN